MSINTTLAGLSTNPALNGPDGATDLPSQIDDAIRYHGAFIAQLRDGTGFSAGAIVAGLGYTPVQQGTGTSQQSNAIKIGWGASSQLRVQIDSTDYGVNWPINITGNAATANSATSANNANNANTVAGIDPIEFVRRGGAHALGLYWDSGNGFVVPTVDGTVQASYTTWSKVDGRPTDLGSFTNGPGYMVDGDVIRRGGAATSIGNSGSTHLTVNIAGAGAFAWPISPSDERLKKDIAPTAEDSLSKIKRIDIKQFRFRDDMTEAAIDDGRLHKAGPIAQQLQGIDSEWVTDVGTWLAPDQQKLLYAALHAIQQLEAKVAALEGSK